MSRRLFNLVNGKWIKAKKYENVVNVLTGEKNFKVPVTSKYELKPFIHSINRVSKSGLHNPFKNPERYLMLGEVCFKTANILHNKKVEKKMIREIVSVTGKTEVEAKKELVVTRNFLENFSGDQVRFLGKGINTPGDYFGQMANSFRWPYGSTAVISPFNFPLEIPMLQLMGSLFMGNKCILKTDSRVSLVMDSMLKILHLNGLPRKDVDFIHCDGKVMENLLMNSNIRLTQFTGSKHIAERLSKRLNGKVKIEDAGFDWKIIGPMDKNLRYDEQKIIYETCNHDSYTYSGQKCSAQSILFIHKSWNLKKFQNVLEKLSKEVNMGPLLSLNNDEILYKIENLLKVEGAQLWFGNEILDSESIPSNLGYISPTCIFIPIESIKKKKNHDIVLREIFGPVQVVTEYENVDDVLNICENMENHLTGAVVSNDPKFVNYVIGQTVNGTTYTGIKARTTGAPQNHWFGPCGDPRSAGIGTPESIIQTWSAHREIIRDEGKR